VVIDDKYRGIVGIAQHYYEDKNGNTKYRKWGCLETGVYS